MKRVVVLPLLEAARFHDLEIIARGRHLAAFVGNTDLGRARAAYDSEEVFLEAVARGFADRFTFNTLEEAATFAKQKLEDLARAAQKIEDPIGTRATQRRHPKKDKGGLLRVVQQKRKAKRE